MNDETDPLRTEDQRQRDPSDIRTIAYAQITRIGRYPVDRLLGKGGFGRVYLAHDSELDRPVAIKLPHPERAATPGEKSQFLVEARALARLNHRAIVPVYDFGTTEEGCCYIVSKFIDGGDLASLIRKSTLQPIEAAGLAATIADGLHHAHTNGLFHRDVKPGNILIDQDGNPFVADFGLALREEDTGHGYLMAGTPAYMSPEQARGEGHRVDGRSDVFSLGVVLYEMLTGRRPHKKWDSVDDLLREIVSAEIRPPRQLNDRIPRELERICLRALSKRAVDRYTTAKDFSDDLRAFLDTAAEIPESAGPTPVPLAAEVAATPASQSGSLTDSAQTPSHQRPLNIVPKGLRAFDANDAYFFLELLPGVRDRDGLPESIRFWKLRIESEVAAESFAVGLIYGPSGCGKSSLVRAGLLPLLSERITPLYLEATPDQTETQLEQLLKQRFPQLARQNGLARTLTALRHGEGIPAGQKLLIVLDQFEQWLHSNGDPHDAALVTALRQCDGERLQCLLGVRDDFWMAVTRFMQQLEIRVVEGVNSAAADRFNLRHARKVLTAFGRAYGALPSYPTPLDKEQEAFLDHALRELAEDEQVIPVRLTLFAEMLKGKPWSPATLKSLGGMEGVGVAFLKGTFDGRQAPPEHRHHQAAIRGVLQALLPAHGGDIKGHQRSRAELLEASGYARRPDDVDEVLRILDQGVRLITPTDTRETTSDNATEATSTTRYQLAHDYLVPAIREWLNLNKRKSLAGRAELRLQERAALWSAQRESKQLPSLWEWSRIRLLTRRWQWSPEQRQMMQLAGRYHLRRGITAAVLLLLVVLCGVELQGRWRAAQLSARLTAASWGELPAVNAELLRYRRWTEPGLRRLLQDAQRNSDAPAQLRASLALMPMDPTLVDDVFDQALSADSEEIAVLSEDLLPYHEQWSDRAWEICSPRNGDDDSRRLRAAALLAAVDPEDPRWDAVGSDVAQLLVNETFIRVWMQALRPVRDALRGKLVEFFASRDASLIPARTRAGELLIDYYSDDGPALVELLPDAHASHFAALLHTLSRNHAGAPALVADLWASLPDDVAGDDDRNAQRKANCGVALISLGEGELVWPTLAEITQPDVRNWLIDRMAPLGVEPETLAEHLRAESDVAIRRALLLALGSYRAGELAADQRNVLVDDLETMLRDDPDPGIHGAAEWLLRSWNKPVPALSESPTGTPVDQRHWYRAVQEHTMVVVEGPAEFWMGSAETELNRSLTETRHRRRIERTFAIASKEVTVNQFRRFLEDMQITDFTFREQYAPQDGCPQISVSWYQAAGYCNWLSAQQDIPRDQWCYLANDAGKYDEGMQLVEGYLGKAGYRLPSEAEWEYACRAHTDSTRSFGEAATLAANYAWHLDGGDRRSSPVGLLKPNELGLFDMLGNVWEWTLDPKVAYVTSDSDLRQGDAEHDDLSISLERVLRGGSFANPVGSLRSASRASDEPPSIKNASFGFRVARTLPAG